MSGTRKWNSGIAARGSIYVANDNKVYASAVPAGGTPTPTATATSTATGTATATATADSKQQLQQQPQLQLQLPLQHLQQRQPRRGTPTSTPTATATVPQSPTPTPTPSACYLNIIDPDCGSVINSQPVDFTVILSNPPNPSNVQPTDFMVNGTPADSYMTVNFFQIVFHFNTYSSRAGSQRHAHPRLRFSVQHRMYTGIHTVTSLARPSTPTPTATPTQPPPSPTATATSTATPQANPHSEIPCDTEAAPESAAKAGRSPSD